jgi:cysteinyl-tRNA synthetase
MSKSLKNFITVNDLLTQGYEGVAIRLMLLSTHYRKPFDFNQKNLDDAVKTIKKFHEIILANKNPNIDFNNKKASNDLLNSLTEDLNISKAIAHLHNCYKKIKLGDNSLLQQFIYDLDFLGILNINYKI